MITYEDFLVELNSLAEPSFAAFQCKLIKDEKLKIMGVRTPYMRRLAKKYAAFFGDVFSFPDEYYEVVFIKLQIAAKFDFERLLKVLPSLTPLISNWALCDCFAPACIKKNRELFVPYIKKYLCSELAFERRFALTTLLHFYVEEGYASLITECITVCNPSDYYVAMGAAWLLAELAVKCYDAVFEYLNSTMCDIIVKNKAISKACDSFRLTKEQKDELKRLKNK